jgi:hypothetical protein
MKRAMPWSSARPDARDDSINNPTLGMTEEADASSGPRGPLWRRTALAGIAKTVSRAKSRFCFNAFLKGMTKP